MRSRRVFVLVVALVLLLALPITPTGAVEWNTVTFEGTFTPGTNPCDGSAVPERTGTTTLAVAEVTSPSGQTRVFVKADLALSGGEYVTVLRNSARFNEAADSYTFPAKSVTYRNGVREYVSFATQTVFMSGDQPVAHSVFGGNGSICVRSDG